MDQPLISVVMPVYNAEKYLAKAIDSILFQTHRNFEFLIFDDGSTDDSKHIIAHYVEKDRRIIPFYYETNSGYVYHLNQGILHARGEFIARMDSDDIALADRLLVQLDFLQRTPGVAVVGSSTIVIDDEGEELNVSLRKKSHKALFWQSFFTNPLAHPTVMFRKSIILKSGLYNPDRSPAEDFDLWTRVLRVSRISNIERPLLKYRQHQESISHIKAEKQNCESIRSLQEHWLYFCSCALWADCASFFKSFHKDLELSSLSAIRRSFFLILQLYFVVVKRYGFVRYVEHDAFNKLLYLALRSLRFSYSSFFQLLVLLILVFPFRACSKVLKK